MCAAYAYYRHNAYCEPGGKDDFNVTPSLPPLPIICAPSLSIKTVCNRVLCCVLVYTVYALMEYFVVLSNLAFHGSAVFEFGHALFMTVFPPDLESFVGKQE